MKTPQNTQELCNYSSAGSVL